LLCIVYIAQLAVLASGEAQIVANVDSALKHVEKRSTAEDKRGFRPDLGKRDEKNGGLVQQPLEQLVERQQRSRRGFRGDLGKRGWAFRGDLGKRPFRGDLGKRGDMEGDIGSMAQLSAEKRPSFRGDLGKRWSFRGDLGKRVAPLYDSWSDIVGDDAAMNLDDFSKRRYAFRGDLGKRPFRGDLGK